MSTALAFLLCGAAGFIGVILGSALLLFPDPDLTPEPHEDEQ